jgi:diacylglycerol kinase family enzyme
MESLSPQGWRAVDPPRRPVLFINPRSGGGRAEHANLVERARERGIDVLVLQTHQDLAALVGEAVAGGADALGVAGGDGSLAVVATAARANALPFVCIPAGTRNHLALDLGVDRHDLVGALDAFTDGVERAIDVAEVNGLVFLNNVSLGIYGDAVHQSAYRDAKLRTLARTAASVLGPSAGIPEVQLVDDVGRGHPHPAVVLVSNNPSTFSPLGTGTRPRLDCGQLGIVVLDAPPPGADLPARAWTATRLEVKAAAPVHAGVDGEAVDLPALLEFVIRPGALRVRISTHHPGVSPSG